MEIRKMFSISQNDPSIVSQEGFFGLGSYAITKVKQFDSAKNSPIYRALQLCSDVLTNDPYLSMALSVNNAIKYQISLGNTVSTTTETIEDDNTVNIETVTTRKSEMSVMSDLVSELQYYSRVAVKYEKEINDKLAAIAMNMNLKENFYRKVGYWEIPGLFRNCPKYSDEVNKLLITIDKGIAQVKLVEGYGAPKDIISKVVNHLNNVKKTITASIDLLDKNILIVKGNELIKYGV